MEIKVKSWKVIEDEKKNKTVAGVYAVMNGPVEVAKQDFNEGYSNTPIAIPAELLVKIQKIDAEVCKAVEDNFGV